jgi:hypothetical protein
MIKELASYAQINPIGIFPGNPPIEPEFGFPSLIEGWIEGVNPLIMDIFSQRSAVEMIQDKYFDGHPILCRDVEDDLEEVIRRVEQGVAAFNVYLNARAELSKAECNSADGEYRISSEMQSEHSDLGPIDLDAIRRKLNPGLALARAQGWVEEARKEATASFLRSTGTDAEYIPYQRDRAREMYGGRT